MSQISKTPESLANTINRLNTTFEQAEKVCSEEVSDFIEEKRGVIAEITDDYSKDIVLDGKVILSRAEVINLQILVDDYRSVRETLLSTVKDGKSILEGLTLRMMDSEEGTSASEVMAFSSLVGSINQSVKILASSYKDISAVLINLDKLENTQNIKNVTVNGNVNITNTQNNQENKIISTTDLIKQLQIKKSES